jgi:predicted Zn-dependent protease
MNWMGIGRTKTGLCLAFLAGFPWSTAPAQSNSGGSDSADYSRAENLVRNHQWDESLELIQHLLANDPHNLRALNLAGIAYGGKGDSQRADQSFEACLKVNSHFLPALKNLSIDEFNQRQYVPAEKHLLMADQQLPNDPAINLYLAEIAYRQEKFKLAAQRFDRAKDIVAHNPNLTAHFGVSLFRSDQKQRAREVTATITPAEIDPQSALAMGISLVQSEMSALAVPYLQAAFAHDPASYDTGYDLAVAAIQAKEFETAIATAKDLIRQGHDTSELENIFAEALAATGEINSAIEAYKKAIKLDPQDENNYLDFTSLCIDHRAFEDGMEVITLGLEIHPKSERMMFMRGVLQASQNEMELAEKDFQEASLLAPQQSLGIVGLGSIYLEQGHSEEAVQVIRARLRQKPEDASLLYLLGENLMRSGALPGQPAYSEAQAALEKSVKLNPGLCLPHISLGSIYMEEARYADAAVQFEQARAIDPTEKSSYSHLAVAYRRLGQPEKASEALTALKQVLAQGRVGGQVKTPIPAERGVADGSETTVP